MLHRDVLVNFFWVLGFDDVGGTGIAATVDGLPEIRLQHRSRPGNGSLWVSTNRVHANGPYRALFEHSVKPTGHSKLNSSPPFWSDADLLALMNWAMTHYGRQRP